MLAREQKDLPAAATVAVVMAAVTVVAVMAAATVAVVTAAATVVAAMAATAAEDINLTAKESNEDCPEEKPDGLFSFCLSHGPSPVGRRD